MKAEPQAKRPSTTKAKAEISPTLIDTVCRRLSRNQRVRRTLPAKGRLHIDRQLPFLCVYRQPADHDDAGTRQLVKGEASYMIASGAPRWRNGVTRLVRSIVEVLSGEFGAILVVEVWAKPDGGKANDPAVPAELPTFTIHAPATAALTSTVEALERRLNRVRILKQGVLVEVVRGGKSHPPRMRPLLSAAEAGELNCAFVGLAVPPVFRQPDSTVEFPVLARSLRRSLSLALRQCYFEFARARTTHRPLHFHALGRRAVVKAVRDIDRKLAQVSDQFDYLLQLTPVNAAAAWKQFQRARFERVPEFHYRPLLTDPALLKRLLYKIPIERVEDPALQRLFQEKQRELELKLTMLRDRDTPRFLYESLQLFGGVKDDLTQLAHALLGQLSGPSMREKGPKLSAFQFAERVEAELAFYRQSSPGFRGAARVSDEVSGLIVSRGELLINADLSLPLTRVEPLLAHEVGAHVVTYHNGTLQPFRQLDCGLAAYEELQEGLAVLAEYLVGGLDASRMRQLAARVVAVEQRIDGASFVDVFRTLTRNYGFTQRTAYNITMRVYRGGGLTKDAIYLRGLQAILQYVQKDGDLQPLLVGKMALEHVPIIKELQYREVLKPPAVIPRYLQDQVALERLARLRDRHCSVLDLISNEPPEDGLAT